MEPKRATRHSRQEDLLRLELFQIIDPDHPLVKLSGMVDWNRIKELFATYCPDQGRSAISSRLIVSLLYLKCMHDLSDEDVLLGWVENPYWQYLSGMKFFQHSFPIDPSSMTRWRTRIVEAGMEKLLKETIEAGLKLKVANDKVYLSKQLNISYQLLQQFKNTTMQQAAPTISIWKPQNRTSIIKFKGDYTERLVHLGSCKTALKNKDLVTRLKSTWIGQFYTNYLKRHKIFRWIIIKLWRIIILKFLRIIDFHFFSVEKKKWRSLIKLSNYVKEKGITTTIVADEEIVKTPIPKIYSIGEQRSVQSSHRFYKCPKVFVAEISECIVYGGTNLTIVKEGVLFHELYDFKHDYTSEELHGRIQIDAKAGRIRWLLQDDFPERVPRAASFVDSLAFSYAHWITEVYPRIALFCSDQRFKNIPIIVDDGLHPNIIESLLVAAGSERTIFLLPIGSALKVDSLYLTSVSGYAPFEKRSGTQSLTETHREYGIYNPRAFEIIVNHTSTFTEYLPPKNWPQKFYIRRNSISRLLKNESEIEELMISRGYVIVEPENLSFLEQVKLFKEAKIIVGTSGSALANIIFSSRGTHIIILFAESWLSSYYWYWQNIAAASGNSINYVLGKAYTNEVHSHFVVSRQSILSAIDNAEKCLI
jgi:capsular polysaccharide biosynthesis protein